MILHLTQNIEQASFSHSRQYITDRSWSKSDLDTRCKSSSKASGQFSDLAGSKSNSKKNLDHIPIQDIVNSYI